MFHKVAVLGVGLIGGSFALALKERNLCREIAGSGRSEENLRRAKDRGIIDSFSTDPGEACLDADLIMLSTPPGSFIDTIRKSAGGFKKGAIVTDAGSVKGDLVYDLERMMPGGVSYIGSHPIAGSESSGIDSASAGLFQGAKCIVTPTADSDREALMKINRLWKALGANVIEMDPRKHDHIYGLVSHLPHLIAYNMVNTVASIDSSYLDFSGQGFRDMTRIAGSHEELWRDICMLNRKNLIEMIGVFQGNLDTLKEHLAASDAASLAAELGRARRLREGIGQG
ncbi:MAG: prephenate dehydrogenase/arogenate dehydrogenase family protein [Nitrospirae bacterium]|nr:prephenate dehydrogenase/arogenate dehydrogenase family protein [Nitrospirota bacterium]